MYGMIHQAARQMSLSVLGEESWKAIASACNLDEEYFISGKYYDDSVAMNLVMRISEAADMAPDALLEAFGHFWISFAGQSSYGKLMDMGGGDLVEFVESLDRMHATIKMTMPDASLPTFDVIHADDARIDVLYCSERSGLHSFVAGLLKGLMERFGEIGAVSWRVEDHGVVFSIERA